MKRLALREKDELEERKKRVDDDEDSKYDMANFLAESKRWRQKAGKYPYTRKPIGSFGISKTLSSSTNMIKKMPINLTDGHTDKTPIKKKNTLTSKKSNNGLIKFGGIANSIAFIISGPG